MYGINIDSLLYKPGPVGYMEKYLTLLPVPHLRGARDWEVGQDIVIYYHGNGCDAGDVASSLYFPGFNTMYMEYPGYGHYIEDNDTSCALASTMTCATSRSTGHNACSSAKIISDVRCLARYLSDKRAVQNYAVEVHIIGESIGSGPACHLASILTLLGCPVASLQLISPFTSINQLAGEHSWGPLRHVVANPYPNLELVRTLNHGVHVHHGTRDTIIGVHHAYEFNHLPNVTLRTYDSDHNEIWDKAYERIHSILTSS